VASDEAQIWLWVGDQTVEHPGGQEGRGRFLRRVTRKLPLVPVVLERILSDELARPSLSLLGKYCAQYPHHGDDVISWNYAEARVTTLLRQADQDHPFVGPCG